MNIPSHPQPGTALFRMLRQAHDGRWWGVSGDGCSAQPYTLTFSPQDRSEMLWSTTGILEGAMYRRWQAVRSDARSLLFPLHYPSESIATLRAQKHSTAPVALPAPWRVDPNSDSGAFIACYTDILRRTQSPAWRGSGVWAAWLTRAYAEAATPHSVWGPDALDYYTHEPATAHHHMAIRTILRTLLPLDTNTCRVWLGRTTP